MSDEYQLRKDIDRFKGFLDALEHTLNTKYGITEGDIEQLLSRFYDVSDIDLLKIKLNNDLDTLNSSLDDLALDLYGADGVDGFVDYLEELQHSIYGKGDKDSGGVEYTINYPSPNSLKGLLNSLNTDTNNLKQTLSVLATYLTNFTGTLNQFKQELTNNGINYSSLNTGITQLLEAIFKAQADIDTVQSDIGDVSQITGTVVSNIQTVDSKAVDIRKELYSGSNDTGTINNPASGTVKANINSVQTDIGDVNVALDSDLSNQSFDAKYMIDKLVGMRFLNESLVLIFYEDYNEYFNEMSSKGYQIRNEVNYGYNYTTNTTYKVVTTNPSNPDILGYWALEQVSASNVPTSTIGICYKLQHTTVKSNERYNFIYEASSNKIYYKNSSKWTVISDLHSVIQYTDIYNLLVDYFPLKKDVLKIEEVYPVGAIYMSVNNVNPSNLFGGTWVRIEDKFLLSSGTNYPATYDSNGVANKTGGEASHTLTVSEMPSHSHNNNSGSSRFLGMATNPADTTSGFQAGSLYANVEKSDTTIANTGGGQAHNNLPPYLVVNVWYRTQ